MIQPRRGILLGLGFTMEALRAAGLTDADLAAIASPLVGVAGDGQASSGAYDIEFEASNEMIDVTGYGDAARRYVPGVQRMTVTFKVALVAAEAWQRAIMNDQPVQFDEVVGDLRLSCLMRVVRIETRASMNDLAHVTVTAHVSGAPTITDRAGRQLEQVATEPAGRQRRTAILTGPGRRTVRVTGRLID